MGFVVKIGLGNGIWTPFQDPPYCHLFLES